MSHHDQPGTQGWTRGGRDVRSGGGRGRRGRGRGRARARRGGGYDWRQHLDPELRDLTHAERQKRKNDPDYQRRRERRRAAKKLKKERRAALANTVLDSVIEARGREYMEAGKRLGEGVADVDAHRIKLEQDKARKDGTPQSFAFTDQTRQDLKESLANFEARCQHSLTDTAAVDAEGMEAADKSHRKR